MLRFEQINEGNWRLLAGEEVIGEGYDVAMAFADAMERLATVWRDHKAVNPHYHPHPVPPAA